MNLKAWTVLAVVALAGDGMCQSAVGDLEDVMTVNPIPYRTQIAQSLSAEYLVRMEPYPGYRGYTPESGPPAVYVFRWVDDRYEPQYSFSLTVPQRLVMAADNGYVVTIGWLSFERKCEVLSVYSEAGLVGVLAGDGNFYSDLASVPEQEVEYWVDWSAPIEWEGKLLYVVSEGRGPMLIDPANAVTR